MRSLARLFVLPVLLLAACTEASSGDPGEAAEQASTNAPASADPQADFWASIMELCGQAFEGQIAESVPPENSFAGQRLVMHVRSCEEDEIRIPFFVGDDRSRTWVVTRTADGLRLKHDHRHEDGTEEEITQYGGDTPNPGTPTLQDFEADAHTGEIVPAAAPNVWSIEIHPGETFAYALRRTGSERRFRAEFDLTAPIDEPPPPWGA